MDHKKLNLGCGQAKLSGYINLDYNEALSPDIVCNVLDGLPFDDNSFDEVLANDFLEHIPAGQPVVNLIEEIYRILKPNGLFISSTPNAEYGQAAFQDPFHVSFWVENSWWYYSDPAPRSLYNIKANFRIESLERVPALETKSRLYWLKVKAIALKET